MLRAPKRVTRRVNLVLEDDIDSWLSAFSVARGESRSWVVNSTLRALRRMVEAELAEKRARADGSAG